jgi:hypothetical protein
VDARLAARRDRAPLRARTPTRPGRIRAAARHACVAEIEGLTFAAKTVYRVHLKGERSVFYANAAEVPALVAYNEIQRLVIARSMLRA